MKKVTIVLMILFTMLLVISTTGCGKVEEIRDKVAAMISEPTPAAKPTSASAPINAPNEKSSATIPSTSPTPVALDATQTKPRSATLPPPPSTVQKPDLIIQDITWRPLNPSPGETVTFTVTIKNQGDDSAVASRVGYYVDGSQKGSGTVSSIPAGGITTRTFTWRVERLTYTVKAVADYNDDVLESDETNNEKEITFSGTPVPEPDLIIQDISWSPLNPSPGETVTLTVTIKNQGGGSAVASQVNYYVDGSQEGSDNVSSIPAGGTTTGTFIWNAESGNHTIKAVADYNDDVPESDETNNEKETTSSKIYLADLIIQSITWSPPNPSSGETVTFTFAVKNQGNGGAGPSTVYYYIGDYGKGPVPVSSISAGGTASGNFTWSTAHGNPTIAAVADYFNAVSESDESNNIKQVTVPKISASETSLADLIIQDITWSPLNPSPGETVTFTVTVKNQGGYTAVASQVYGYVDGSQKGSNTISSISAGGTATVTFTWNAELGEHVIKAVADYNDDVSETDETNNEKEITFSGTSVPKPDLIIQDITWLPRNPSAGETVTFTVTVKNQGSASASPFWVYYYIDGSRENPGRFFIIPAGGTMSETLTWEAKPGTHTIKAIANQYNQLPESDITNNDREVTFVVQ